MAEAEALTIALQCIVIREMAKHALSRPLESCGVSFLGRPEVLTHDSTKRLHEYLVHLHLHIVIALLQEGVGR